MMDLKDIIKWFIPCYHVFIILNKRYIDVRVIFLCGLFLIPNRCYCSDTNSNLDNFSANNSSGNNSLLINSDNSTDLIEGIVSNFNISDVISEIRIGRKLFGDSSRTFGRPMKKLAAALIPLAFQIGAASTWAILAALVGIKTLAVALLILKLLLVAGAAKFGSLFSKVGHQQQESWSSPQKEIHLHIHNSPHGVQETHSDWSRDGATVSADPKTSNPEPFGLGPETINTPYGNYVRIGPPVLRRR